MNINIKREEFPQQGFSLFLFRKMTKRLKEKNYPRTIKRTDEIPGNLFAYLFSSPLIHFCFCYFNRHSLKFSLMIHDYAISGLDEKNHFYLDFCYHFKGNAFDTSLSDTELWF